MQISGTSSSDVPIRLITHNIRYATTTPFRGEEKWSVRLPYVVNSLKLHTRYIPASFICLQEVLHSQLLDILGSLNATTPGEWAYIGVGRDDGAEAGEYAPILYRPKVWRLNSWKTIWLSETPTVPSKSWDAACIRVLTIGEFTNNETGTSVMAMNTHLDDQGSVSRTNAAKMIIAQVEKAAFPTFLTGDFNSEPNEEAYSVLNAAGSPVSDLRDYVGGRSRYGHENTFTGFGYEEDVGPKRIDFLFLSGMGKQIERGGVMVGDASWTVEDYGVLESRFDDGVYASDHRAVLGDVLLHSW
ncbi:endonuclease/exonuclease/phosphatase family protein [Morchella snyderi]|nr:endonuclease/exonuclease/phosphatase family protein [Morchella snyderi]